MPQQQRSTGKDERHIRGNRTVSVALVVVILAAVPRLVWFRSHQPDLPPDSFGYLNVAREWRGEQPPGEWDDRGGLPWDNQATRTPGYPLFLDLVFAGAGHSATPPSALTMTRPLLASGEGTGARAFHLRHLETDENVRAVQAVQHVVAVVGATAAFLTLVEWTGSMLIAVLGALLAIGWNPVSIITFEPAVLAETLSSVLLILTVTFVTYRRVAPWFDDISLGLGALAVVVRPPMLVPLAAIATYVLWARHAERLPAIRVLVFPLSLLVLVVLNNVVRYGYWGLASNGPTTLASHAADHPEGFREPIRTHVQRYHPYLRGGLLQYSYAVATHRRFLDVGDDISTAARGFIVDHPIWYAKSVLAAFVEFCSPPFRHVGGDRNTFRQRWPYVWLAISVTASVVALAGVGALLLPVSAAVKLGSTIFLVSAISTSLLAHTENRRFAAPVMPFLLMSGTAACAHYRMRAKRAVIAEVGLRKG